MIAVLPPAVPMAMCGFLRGAAQARIARIALLGTDTHGRRPTPVDVQEDARAAPPHRLVAVRSYSPVGVVSVFCLREAPSTSPFAPNRAAAEPAFTHRLP